ncbi:MAG TPA: TonB-dependent receptor, partial [Bryobacteraceae bacterium]|nr:TonB-dependent receptor [Bryobacteraceae bacterium]
MNRISSIKRIASLGLLWFPLGAQDSSPNPPPPTQTKDLSGASLEDLLNVKVTSVSKKEEKLWTAGAAVFVITQDDIRRSGYTNVPDLLRMVPGVNVARMNASTWAISVRGFNDLYADRVLVLVDGRSVFDPMFSGVHWGDLDVPLEDIERIEVVRGPGGTIWGANAVNGVINIITRHSQDTQGVAIRGSAGTDSSGNAFSQFGGSIGDAATYRVFEQYFNIDNFRSPSGAAALDGRHSFHEGFRADWKPTASDTVMVEGEANRTEQGELAQTVVANALPLQASVDGINRDASASLLLRWNHMLASGDELSFQLSGNYLDRHTLGMHYFERSFDFAFQDHLAVGARQDIVWGTELRADLIQTQPGYAFSFWAPYRNDFFESLFAQDQIRLTDSLSLTVGSKFELNDYTGFEFEPSAQLIWTPTARQTLWASAARAVRQPNMTDLQLRGDVAIVPAPGFPFGVITTQGNPNPVAEAVKDYELGYRVQAGKRLFVDVAAFANFSRNNRIGVPLAPFVGTTPQLSYLVIPFTFDYDRRVQTRGGEIFATWDVTSKWRLSPGYSLFHLNQTYDPVDVAVQPVETGLTSPAHQF